MNIAFGQVEFGERELVEQFADCNTLVCLKMTNSLDDANELSKIIWDRISSQLPRKNYIDDFTVWVFSETKDCIFDYCKKLPLTISQVRRLIPKKSLNNTRQAELAAECDICLGNLLLTLDTESRLQYIYKDICGLSYRKICRIFEEDEHIIRKGVNRTRRKVNNFLDSNCPLYNPDNSKKSDRAKQIFLSDLPTYVKEVRQNSHKVNIFTETEGLIERDNFWSV